MDRTKKLLILLGVLVVACGVTFGVTRYNEDQEEIKNSDEVIVELDKSQVTALSWTNETTSLAFHRQDDSDGTSDDNEIGTWVYDTDEAFPVDEDKVSELLDLFSSFGVSFEIDNVEDYSQYGLSDPVCTIQITTAQELDKVEAVSEEDGSYTYEIKLGDFSKMDSQRYVSIGDGNAYLVSTDPLEEYDAELTEMVENDTLPEMTRADAITFSGDVAYGVTYEEDSGRSYQADDVYFVNGGDEDLPLDTTLVGDYLSAVSGLSLSEYVTYNATDEELASYGLDSPDLTVNVDYVSEDEDGEETTGTLTLNISRDPTEKAEAEKEEASEASDSEEEEEEEEITAYARVGESQIVYKLDGSDYETLMKASYNDLRHQNIFYGDLDDVTQIDISMDGQDYTITGEGEDDDRTWTYDGKELESFDLGDSLTALAADSFTDETADGEEEIRLTLHLDNETYPQIEIALYRYDGESCLAVVDGQTVAKVSRSSVVDVTEDVNTIVLAKE